MHCLPYNATEAQLASFIQGLDAPRREHLVAVVNIIAACYSDGSDAHGVLSVEVGGAVTTLLVNSDPYTAMHIVEAAAEHVADVLDYGASSVCSTTMN